MCACFCCFYLYKKKRGKTNHKQQPNKEPVFTFLLTCKFGPSQTEITTQDKWKSFLNSRVDRESKIFQSLRTAVAVLVEKPHRVLGETLLLLIERSHVGMRHARTHATRQRLIAIENRLAVWKFVP